MIYRQKFRRQWILRQRIQPKDEAKCLPSCPPSTSPKSEFSATCNQAICLNTFYFIFFSCLHQMHWSWNRKNSFLAPKVEKLKLQKLFLAKSWNCKNSFSRTEGRKVETAKTLLGGKFGTAKTLSTFRRALTKCIHTNVPKIFFSCTTKGGQKPNKLQKKKKY